ncbi:MAG: SDR family NAD(P)-dependent oxidoreductase [Dokdonella sp.]|uniref:SDR family NAD(P)-dependent oxidoreductase n=1 Tax=Dokdonella sp. TaxID=2291710 RepID=UPI0032657D71
MLESARLADGFTASADGCLRDRVVLVTGATGGLGRAVSLAAASAGASVVLLGRKVRALESLYDDIVESGAPTPAIYPMDLAGATARDHAELASSVEREFSALHGLVHAAAQFDSLQPFEQQTAEEWARTQQVNVTAPFLLTQACVSLMRRSDDAAIVFVFDDPARVGKAFWGGYGVAKHAVQGLASIVHQETESSGVRTHAILPGPMRTALRRAAYYGENTMEHPDPAFAAGAIVHLLGATAGPLRGKVLDLRESQRS